MRPAANFDAVVVRHAGAGDADRIRVLAHLENRRLPAGPYLVADIAGETLAAIAIDSGIVIADPFQRTRDTADLLRMRAAQIRERARFATRRAGRQTLTPAAA